MTYQAGHVRLLWEIKATRIKEKDKTGRGMGDEGIRALISPVSLAT